MLYIEKLQDPRWQKKRLKIFERDGWRCVNCGRDEQTLHVHHVKYSNGEPWEVEDSSLLTLCHDCHASISGKDVTLDGCFHVFRFAQRILKDLGVDKDELLKRYSAHAAKLGLPYYE